MEHKKLLEQYITKLSSSKHLFGVFEECIMTNNSTYHDNTNIFLPQVIKTCSHIVFGPSEGNGPLKGLYKHASHTVCSNMIVLKVFYHRTLKIEFIGSIFDLNSTQVGAILCKCAILKKNSLLNPNSVTSNESWKSGKLEMIGIFRCYRMS